ncbi:MAG: hypothetical protein LBE20_03810 [Deltaproteobacteria bacterium]|jgi:hypothetical protein|nr:hypothetical protein [Deltaproteobacteria bacterium]
MDLYNMVTMVPKSMLKAPGRLYNFIKRAPKEGADMVHMAFDNEKIILPEPTTQNFSELKINPNVSSKVKNYHQLYTELDKIGGMYNLLTENPSKLEKLIFPADYVSRSLSKKFGNLLGSVVGFSMTETKAYVDLMKDGAKMLRDKTTELAMTLVKASLVFARDGFSKLQTYLVLIGAMATVLSVEEDGQKSASELGLARNLFQWDVFLKVAGTLLKITGSGIKAVTSNRLSSWIDKNK